VLGDPAGLGVSWTQSAVHAARWYARAFIVGDSLDLARIFNSFSILKVTK
jgi:hypothetical protein